MHDPKTKRKYWYNNSTGETQWEPPTGGQAAEWEAQVDEASGDTFYVNIQTGEAQWELPPQ